MSADLSVVIPSFNRRHLLRRALESYEVQVGSGFDFEVIVVDDGSTDGTMDLLAEWRPQSYVLRFTRQDNSGPAQARNRALEMASGGLILFTGDDIVPSRHLLLEHWRAHAERPEWEVAIIGKTRWPEDLPTTYTMRHVDGPGAQQFSFHYFEDGAVYDFRHFYTSNVSLKRQLLDREPNHFSTDFRRAAFEDVELSYRLSLHGMRIHYRAAAVADHYHHYEAPSFFRRQQACGEMAAVLYAKFPVLERWLGVRDLDALRLTALRSQPADWRQASRMAERLEEMEERVMRLILPFEAEEQPHRELDALLVALFRYAYLTGLARARYDEAASRRLCGYLIHGILGPAAGAFLAKASPVPGFAQADARALERYAF